MQGHRFSQRVSDRPLLGIFAAALLFFSTVACATDRPRDYRFKVVDQPVAVGPHSEFDLKLTDASTGRPVENASISHADLKMTMPRLAHKNPPVGGGSRKMGGDVEFVGMPAPGLYRFLGDVSMSGTWTLDLTAKVPGEPEPIAATLTFEAGQ